MPIINSIAAMRDEIAEWRRDIHANPELGFEEVRTSGLVAEQLRSFGCDEVATGIGRTGVVAVIKGRKQGSGKVIGLRCDMDALPIDEATGLPYASNNAGVMHACGHDGHTAMLLGAAKYLGETRNFDGTAVLIFQPAEEGKGGGREMVNEGMLDRFGVQEVYGMHNKPGMAPGSFAIRPGPMMAAADRIFIEVRGKGTHAAYPHLGIDPIVAASHIVVALQSIVARNINPLQCAVITIGRIRGGHAGNVVPADVKLLGTARTFSPEIQDIVEKRVVETVEFTARALGAEVDVTYKRDYPVTINAERETRFAAGVAEAIAGEGKVNLDVEPSMGAEDFSFMLNARPGAMIWIGNGDTANLHNPAYNFNDDIIPAGVSYWAKLVETAMATGD
ncbi:MAG: amidohydrolase [Alphaproteobacteria bacterium]|nr:amidohydrolase [Alphaproteobacteria bacterium]